MAIPKVFVSSTCYDLKYIREDLKFFIRTIGYEPILSDDGDVYYNPCIHTHESCISEVETCQIFVLIIGGRYGGTNKETGKSITNMEYERAKELGIPIFTLIEQTVYSNHHVFTENMKEGSPVNAKKIKYPSVDNIRIFDFIDEVRKSASNNAVFPFANFSDIQSYLRKQWAGMMYYYITTGTEAKRTNELFSKIQEATSKIEFFTRQTASSVGTESTKLTIELYDLMLHYDIIRDLAIWGVTASPKLVIQNESIDELCNNNILTETDEEDPDSISITHGGPPYRCSPRNYNSMKKKYNQMRLEIINKIESSDITIEEFINSQL